MAIRKSTIFGRTNHKRLQLAQYNSVHISITRNIKSSLKRLRLLVYSMRRKKNTLYGIRHSPSSTKNCMHRRRRRTRPKRSQSSSISQRHYRRRRIRKPNPWITSNNWSASFKLSRRIRKTKRILGITNTNTNTERAPTLQPHTQLTNANVHFKRTLSRRKYN